VTPTDAKYFDAFSTWLRGMGAEVQTLGTLLEDEAAPARVRRASAEALSYVLRSFELIPEGLEGLGYLDDLFAVRALAKRASESPPDWGSAYAGERLAEEEERSTDHAVHSGESELGAGSPEAEGSFDLSDSVSDDEDPATDVEPSPEERDTQLEEQEPSEDVREVESEVESVAGQGSFEPQQSWSAARGGASAAELAEPSERESSSAGEDVLARLSAEAALVAEFLGDDYELLEAAAFAPKATEAKGRTVADLLYDPTQRQASLSELRAWAQGYRAPTLNGGEEELVKLRSFFSTRLRRAG
jgi:uncharacterized membrane protein YkvA (DUF1232 family)